ncbi:MAG: hypothetical protein U5O39_20010 [Gammaproteobacteria bacterium]|nr:hypothetical protein [Gammaproteobacteria bacterium]
MTQCISTYYGDLIGATATLVAAGIVVAGGIWAYFRQKEFELVQRRYLEEGVDIVIATLDNALNTYNHNWTRCIELLKSFRDNPDFDPDELSRSFLTLPPDKFALTANYRLNRIIDSPVVWRAFQSAIAFAHKGCTMTRNEIPEALRAKLTTDLVAASRAELVEESEKILKELDEEYLAHHFLISKLHDIAMDFEGRKFSLKDVEKMKERPKIKQALKELEERYGQSP